MIGSTGGQSWPTPEMCKPGFCADLIAVAGDPLADVDALRAVVFVTKTGTVFKRDGVMTPAAFFHPGPVRRPNGRWTR